MPGVAAAVVGSVGVVTVGPARLIVVDGATVVAPSRAIVGMTGVSAGKTSGRSEPLALVRSSAPSAPAGASSSADAVAAVLLEAEPRVPVAGAAACDWMVELRPQGVERLERHLVGRHADEFATVAGGRDWPPRGGASPSPPGG